MEWRKPESYWEGRTIIAENVVEAFMAIMGNAMPHIRAEIDMLTEEWNNSLDEIEREFQDKGE